MAFTKKYPTGAAFEKAVNAFLSECNASNTFPSEPAMLLYLDISDDTLRNYEKDKDKTYSAAIKKAQIERERWLSEKLITDRYGTSAAIFLLKQAKNGGYRDVQETSGAMNITLNLPGMSGSNFGK
jgi:hypothetical protein